MAIKREKQTKKDSTVLPERLDVYVREGMTASCLEKYFKEEGSAHRKNILDYLESNIDGFDADMSKAIKTEYGNVTMKSRKTYEIDKDKILALIEEGAITIATLVNLSNFNAIELEKVVGERKFNDLAKEKTTEYLELRPNAEFKAEVQATIESTEEERPTVTATFVEEKPAKKSAKKPMADESNVEASLARLKKLKEKSKSVDEDLEDILG